MKGLAKSRSQLPVQGVRLILDEAAKYKNVIHLEIGEPDIQTPPHIREAAERAMADGMTTYTANAGIISLREAIIKQLKKYDVDVQADEIAVTTGAMTSLYIALLALVDAEEEVLIPDPCWPNYEIMIQAQGAKPIRYELEKDHQFRPNFEQLRQLVTEKTKVIMINTPSNPTGAIYSEAVIKEILAFAKEHNLYVISDEVYDQIIFDNHKHISPKAFDEDGRVLSIYSFSKSYAMTGWRVGYTVATKEIIEQMAKLIEIVIACAPAFAQKAAETALATPEAFLTDMSKSYERRRDAVLRLLNEANIHTYTPQGAFYIMVDLSQTAFTSSTEFAFRLLAEEQVAVAPGETFGETTKRMVRLSLATKEEDLLEGVRRLCRFIKKHEK